MTHIDYLKAPWQLLTLLVQVLSVFRQRYGHNADAAIWSGYRHLSLLYELGYPLHVLPSRGTREGTTRG